ncbi:MAG: twin-arginine translocase TatA/TatE family subunit [Cardiobacteriaceae bacterium]|nr:twin-arginine translocase TatA/TatE family subunit [Cardiobacteriaceae bacterium]
MGISPFQLLIVLIIAIFIFGSGRIKNLGADLGAAIKGFKNEMNKDNAEAPKITQSEGRVIEGEAKEVKKDTV